MNFDKLKTYFEDCLFAVREDGFAPFRRLIVSKGIQGSEIYEKDWVELSQEEQFKRANDIVTIINDLCINNKILITKEPK